MKKILIISILFFVVSCASTEQTKKEPSSPMDNVSRALEKITLPKF
jgi:hypothetical protein